MKIITGLVIVAVLGTSTSTAQDQCVDVLKYASRNESIETYSLATARDTYENICSGSTVKSSASSSVGLGAVVEALPIEFNLGSGSTSERASYFCKTYFGSYKKNESRFKSTNTVVIEAVGAWRSCMDLFGKGVEFKPRISSTQLLVEVRRVKVDVPVRVEGIKYDPLLLKCDVPSTDSLKTRTVANDKTVKTILDEVWTISCTREAKKIGNETIYPKADIGIATTRGTFLMPIPADALFPYQWSSEIEGRLSNFQQALSLVESRGAPIRYKQFPLGIRTGPEDIYSDHKGRTRVTTTMTRHPVGEVDGPIRGAWVEWPHHIHEQVRYSHMIPQVVDNKVWLDMRANNDSDVSISTITVHVLYEVRK